MKFSGLSRKNLIFLLFSLFLTTSLFAGLMTDVRATPSPTNLSPANGTVTNDNTPFFDWTDVSGTDNYGLQISTDITFAVINNNIVLSGGSPSSYTQPTALADGVHYWRARSYDSAAGGWSAPSTAWSLTIDTHVMKLG